jgi:pyruvate-formate lyase-activating enzyme
MQVLSHTLAVCSKNLRPVNAKVVEENGKVYLEKECGEKVLVDSDAELYKKFVLPFKMNGIEGKNIEEIWQKLRKEVFSTALYITSKCNLHCKICYLNFAHSMHDMTIEEIKEFLKKNKSRFISLTGGEPTVRKDLPKIIRLLTKRGRKVLIITNGIKLANKKYVRKLEESGLFGVYLSFDGFDEKIYREFRGKNLLKKKLKALKNLEEEGVSTILVPVIRKNFNENEVKRIIDYANKHLFIEEVRFLTEYPNYNFFISDGYKLISRNYNISLDYFVDIKRILWKFKKLTSLFKNIVGIDHCVVPLKRGSLKPLFNPTDNEIVKLFKIFKEGVSVMLWRIFGRKTKSILKICFCSIYTPLTWDFNRPGMIFSESNASFEKVKGKFPIHAMVGVPA